MQSSRGEWCVYGKTSEELHIGKVVEKNERIYSIRTSKSNQRLELWSAKYVQEFSKLEEALKYLNKHRKT
jgi:hypothetical protein